jgi:hypothetical protein
MQYVCTLINVAPQRSLAATGRSFLAYGHRVLSAESGLCELVLRAGGHRDFLLNHAVHVAMHASLGRSCKTLKV